MDEAKPKRRRVSKFKIALIALLVVLAIPLVHTFSIAKDAYIFTRFVIPVVSYFMGFKGALTTFIDTHGALPGDMPDAGAILQGCAGLNGSDCNPAAPTAGNHFIGDPDFANRWLSPVTDTAQVPAISAADETVLFWTHLVLADLIYPLGYPYEKSAPVAAGLKDGQRIEFGKTHPPSKLGKDTGFIVFHGNGDPLPGTDWETPRGLLLALVTGDILRGEAHIGMESVELLSVLEYGFIEGKMDDRDPKAGRLRAYGAPECFVHPSDLSPEERDRQRGFFFFALPKVCGAIFLIASQEDLDEKFSKQP